MVKGLINDVRLAAVSFVDRYLARASMAVFATVALGLDLTARFGASKAFWIMAAGFFSIPLVACRPEEARDCLSRSATSRRERRGRPRRAGRGRGGGGYPGWRPPALGFVGAAVGKSVGLRTDRRAPARPQPSGGAAPPNLPAPLVNCEGRPPPDEEENAGMRGDHQAAPPDEDPFREAA